MRRGRPRPAACRPALHRGDDPLIVKLGALIFVLALSKTFSINLQPLGGIWILQTFPAS